MLLASVLFADKQESDSFPFSLPLLLHCGNFSAPTFHGDASPHMVSEVTTATVFTFDVFVFDLHAHASMRPQSFGRLMNAPTRTATLCRMLAQKNV